MLAGCSSAGSQPSAVPAIRATQVLRALAASGGKIDHVVFIVQENRSFDNLFQRYPGADSVGKNRFSDTTAIFVMWDDWGGLYDPPRYKGYDSLGFRVPLLVISPYAKKDYVSHVRYETDCFDFTQPPRAFVPIEAPENARFFLHQRERRSCSGLRIGG